MIKAIFLDIDGTLISGKRPSIKKEVIEGLKQVRKKGIQLFIASGRHMLELEELKLVEQFEFDGYLLLNGGYCIIGSQIIYDICSLIQNIQVFVPRIFTIEFQ